MKRTDFAQATVRDRTGFITRPHEEVPITVIVEGSNSRLVSGANAMISFLTMKADSVFELASQ